MVYLQWYIVITEQKVDDFMKNGFIIANFDDAISNISKLQTDNKLLQITSKGAFEMAKRFDWKIIIKEWQKVIHNLND